MITCPDFAAGADRGSKAGTNPTAGDYLSTSCKHRRAPAPTARGAWWEVRALPSRHCTTQPRIRAPKVFRDAGLALALIGATVFMAGGASARPGGAEMVAQVETEDRKSTRLNSSH